MSHMTVLLNSLNIRYDIIETGGGCRAIQIYSNEDHRITWWLTNDGGCQTPLNHETVIFGTHVNQKEVQFRYFKDSLRLYRMLDSLSLVRNEVPVPHPLGKPVFNPSLEDECCEGVTFPALVYDCGVHVEIGHDQYICHIGNGMYEGTLAEVLIPLTDFAVSEGLLEGK